jgi:hypothetical protein
MVHGVDQNYHLRPCYMFQLATWAYNLSWSCVDPREQLLAATTYPQRKHD